jgi:hypothetical protein
MTDRSTGTIRLGLLAVLAKYEVINVLHRPSSFLGLGQR